MSIVAATLFFTIIPVGYAVATMPVGWLTDWAPGSKKLIISAGLGCTGVVYALFVFIDSQGRYSSLAAVEIGVLCVLMGFVCPMLMVPVLPDMHACRRALCDDASEAEVEDGTNLISSLCA